MIGMTALLAVVAGGFAWPGALAADAADLESLDHAQRLRAVERLGARGDGDLPTLLAPLLSDSDGGVRAAAVRVLLRAGAPEATEAALRWVQAPSPNDRPLGLMILRDAPALAPAARAAVDRCLRDAEVTVRLLALDVLSRHGAGPSFAAVANTLDDDQREVRLHAIRLLEAAGDRRAVTLLLGRLPDGDREVGLSAIHALGVLGEAGAAPALVRLVQSGPDDARLAAIDALGALSLPAATTVLAPLARRRPSDEAGRHALLALGQIATAPALAVLIERLHEPPISPDVKEALRRAGAAAVPSLVGVLDSAGHGASTATVTAAVSILGAIGDRRATAALAGLVDRHHPATVEALQALVGLRDPAALVPLVQAASDGDSDPDVRKLAFDALTATGATAAVAALPTGLADGDRDVRIAALRLAARLGAGVAAPAVLGSVIATDRDLRRQALATLAALDATPPGAMTALLAAARLCDHPPAGADGDREAFALGDALERVAADSDRHILAAAVAHATGAARTPLLRGLVAALSRGRAPAGEVEAGPLLSLVSAGGTVGEMAADALVAANVSTRDEAALIAGFDGAEPTVRARLAPALARVHTSATLAHLRAVLDDQAETPDVRAAVAWAAAGVDDPVVRAALLRQATRPAPPAVVANARAALKQTRADVTWRWMAFRVSRPAGLGPLARQWLKLHTENGEPIWVMTGAAGEARVWNLTGAATISADDPALSLAAEP
ncbi:MAG TPA: HEAT repeat domain-containing protein [Polyangia bacterium]|nr:HEAT repeat domain-containing protein [Polyangia bacterium]